MKSKTSFFNVTALKKNITRFAPAWILYSIFLLVMFFTGIRREQPAMTANNLVGTMHVMAWVNLLYGGICAALLYGDMFNNRMCNALHALPLRRESWLLINVVSGLLFSLVPNTLTALLSVFLLKEYAYMAGIWLIISSLQFVFFFGTGVLSAVCVGNRLAMAAIYGIFHFITMLVYAMVELLYQPLLHGILLRTKDFYRYFPLQQMLDQGNKYVEFQYLYEESKGCFNSFCPDAWQYLGSCALAGIVCVGLAWLVYRRRHLESAGDFIALRPLGPVFLVIYTLGMGAVFYFLSEVFGRNPTYILLAVGLLVGFFTGKMLLSRSGKVFSPKNFLVFAIIAALLAGSMWITWLDPMGITTRIPDVEDVKWAAFYSENDKHMYTQTSKVQGWRITNPDEIEALQDIHRDLTDERFINQGSNGDVGVEILYMLNDGSRLNRFYRVPYDSALGQTTKQYLSDIRYLLQTDDIDLVRQTLSIIEVQTFDIYPDANEKPLETKVMKLTEPEQIAGFLEALQADCDAGLTAQQWNFHKQEALLYYVSFPVEQESQMQIWNYYCDMNIFESCVNTAAYLREMFLINESA